MANKLKGLVLTSKKSIDPRKIQVVGKIAASTAKKLKAEAELLETGSPGKMSVNESNCLLEGYAALLVARAHNITEVTVNVYSKVPSKAKDKKAERWYSKWKGDATKSNIELMWEAQEGLCYICGRKMEAYNTVGWHPNKATVDHIIPLAKGGSKKKSNIALACTTCNSLKGSLRYSDELQKVIMIDRALDDEQGLIGLYAPKTLAQV